MDRSEMRRLAQLVVDSRVVRLCEVGTTSKGRVIGVLVGDPTDAELVWDALVASHTRPHSVECPEWLS